MRKRKGQSTIEVSLVVGMLFLLFIGIVRIMGWFNTDIARRQDNYLYTRVEAGSVQPGMGNPHVSAQLSVLGEEEALPYSPQELIDLVFRTARDPQEAVEALEDLRDQVTGASNSTWGWAARGRAYTPHYVAALDDAIRYVRDNPDAFKSLEETEGFEPMTGKAPGQGWWVTRGGFGQ